MVMLAVLVLAGSILLFSGTGAVVQFAKNSWINPPGRQPPTWATTVRTA